MLVSSLAPRPLAAERSPWLRGILAVPGDLPMSHLALVTAALARGESIIEGAHDGPATLAIAAALAGLGARIERHGGSAIGSPHRDDVEPEERSRWHVSGLGAGGLLEPAEPFAFGGDALGLQLLLGLCAPYDFVSRFEGDPELSARTFHPLLDRLPAFGTSILASDRGRPPIALQGPPVAMPVALTLSSGAPATKAALLLAAAGAPGRSTFIDPGDGWNHAEHMLVSFGASLTTAPHGETSQTIEVAGLPDLRARRVVVPADPALAALGAVAASLVPGSELRIPGVLVNPARTAVLSALVAMGAAIAVHDLQTIAREEVADLVVHHSPLHGIALAANHVAVLIDELPLLAVAAAGAVGETVLHLPPGLSFEIRGRIAALERGLAANGVACEASEDALVIAGAAEIPGGGQVETGGDPGLAMALLVLGMAARRRVTIDDPAGIEERFPAFAIAFEAVGASFVRHTE